MASEAIRADLTIYVFHVVFQGYHWYFLEYMRLWRRPCAPKLRGYQT